MPTPANSICPRPGRRRGSAWSVLALLVAVLAALLAPTGAAYAVVSQPVAGAATAHGSSAAHAGQTAKAIQTAPAAAHRKTVTKPVPPLAAKPLPTAPRTGPAATRATSLRAATTHRLLAQSTVASTCSGSITADTVYPCTAPAGTDTYTLSLPSATDLLAVRAMSSAGGALMITVTAPNGSVVTCQSSYSPTAVCPTTQSGSYTLAIQDGGNAFTLSYVALLSDTSCSAADTSFGTSAVQGTLAAGSMGNCYTLAMTSGSVLHTALTAASYQQVQVTVYDATGTQVCSAYTNSDCALTGTAPYRVLAYDQQGSADSYYLQLSDLTQPQGCVTAAQLTYGQVPDTGSTVACRTLTVTKADQYQVYAASAASGGVTGSLYTTSGTAACANFGPTCQLAAGSYDFVAEQYLPSPSAFGVAFIAADEAGGCTAASDTDFASGAAKGNFAGMGEEICLTLPTASGLTDYMFDQPTADGSSPQMQVLDATGVQQCPNASFTYAVCQLTGTAPFHVVLNAQEANGGYQVLVQRTDSTSGCSAWPQSGFGGSWGAEVTLTPSSTVQCLTIPAAQHSTGEMIDYTNDSNTEFGSINVNDATGKLICQDSTTTVCSYSQGTAYTALVMAVGLTAPDTYKVVRRDVTQTAACTAPTSTTVGGPSTGLVLTSALDAECLKVSAAATDKVWFAARSDAPGQAGVVLEVADPSGAVVCRQWGPSCNVTGSTSYQVLVLASGYAGVAIPAHVDTWRVETASGWAPQCTAHQLSGTGFAPQSGTLTESTTGYCAVVSMPPSELFGIGLVASGGTAAPDATIYDDADWTSMYGLCGISGGVSDLAVQCENTSQAAVQGVLLVMPYTSPTPISYTMQGICVQGCATPPVQATVSSISPASGPADATNQVVLTGTGLNLGTEINLASNGSVVSNYQQNHVVATNAAGTSLTVQLSTSGLTPGRYDLVLNSVGYTAGTPSPGYYPGAYSVTAAVAGPPKGLFKPVGPARTLNNVYGDFTSGQAISHQVVVPVADGKIDVRNGSSVRVRGGAEPDGVYSS
ncbi:hypothetical protein [Streptacidiphilus sp. MAP5-3]|uniref:hypothetical protein n=1 Tax=unclassified Streptacidiphilus TaxID=2643834 RepID=UPI0035177561